DIAALVTMFVFGSVMNAFGMVAPVRSVEGEIARQLGIAGGAAASAVVFLLAVVVTPIVLLGAAAAITGLLTRDGSRSPAQIAINYVYALVPFGFGMWLAHYGFHLLTGALTIV